MAECSHSVAAPFGVLQNMFPFSLLVVMYGALDALAGVGGIWAQKPEKTNSNSNSAAKRMHIKLCS